MKVRVHWSDFGGGNRSSEADVVGVTSLSELAVYMNERHFVEILFDTDVLPTLLNRNRIVAIEDVNADPYTLGLY